MTKTTTNRHICFDLRPLQIGHQNRGIGMHIRSILENLPTSEDYTYSYYCFADSNPITTIKIHAPEGTIITTPRREIAIKKPSHILDAYKLMNHQFSELKSANIDVFVQFDSSLGLPRISGIKTVILAYDLIPLIMRNQYLPDLGHALSHSIGKKAKVKAGARSLYYQQKYSKACRVIKDADLAISISDATRQSFIELIKLDPSHIKTIPLAPVGFSNEKDDSILEKTTKPYIFYIGGTDFRKRVADLVKIFNLLRGRGYDIQLVLAGNEFQSINKLPDVAARNEILASPYKDDIIFVGFVDDKQKLSLYSHARAFVFTSAYEGFGLPLIEAMQSRCPVVCYRNSSLPEVAGDAAIMVDDGHYTAAAKKVAELLDSDELREKYIKRGINQSRQFSWKQYITSFLSTIDKL